MWRPLRVSLWVSSKVFCMEKEFISASSRMQASRKENERRVGRFGLLLLPLLRFLYIVYILYSWSVFALMTIVEWCSVVDDDNFYSWNWSKVVRAEELRAWIWCTRIHYHKFFIVQLSYWNSLWNFFPSTMRSRVVAEGDQGEWIEPNCHKGKLCLVFQSTLPWGKWLLE